MKNAGSQESEAVDAPIDPVEGRIEELKLEFKRLDTSSSDEMGFVYRSWLKGYRGSRDNRGLDADSYYALQHRIIEKIVDSGNVLIAKDATEPEYLIGWLASDVADGAYALHAAYVRSTCRREGVATRMLQHDLRSRGCDPVLYVHTHRGNRWMEDVLAKWGFRPVLGVFR